MNGAKYSGIILRIIASRRNWELFQNISQAHAEFIVKNIYDSNNNSVLVELRKISANSSHCYDGGIGSQQAVPI